ncbi:MAG TPA: DUF721 domain-containing protein [Terriglobia bacterium]|nr:DUF721 domain-containing protein [Terriglobia bacterium]
MEEIGNILPKAFQKHVLRGRRPVIEIMAPLWSRMVGKLISNHSRPVAFEDGVLTIAASSLTWMTQLEGMADPIRAQVNDSLGAVMVKKLRFRPERPAGPTEFGSKEKREKSLFSGAETSNSIPSRAPRPNPVPDFLWGDHGVNLAPELAEVVERSFIKYFSRNTKGSDA